MTTDISNIKKGDRIKNYRVMCELLNEPVKTGEAKKIQIEKWETVMKLTKEGNALIVEDIYPVPLSREDKRRLNKGRSVYYEHIKVQILHYLASQGKKGGINFEFISKTQLHELIGIVNENYKDISSLNREAIEHFVEDHPKQYTVFDVEQFLKYTRKKSREIVKYVLDSLQTEHVIIWKQKYRYWKSMQSEITTDEEDGEVMQLKNKIITMLAEKAIQTGLISKVSDIRTEQDVHLYGLADDFYGILKDQLLKLYGWTKYQVGFQITFHADTLPEKIERYIRDLEEIEADKEALNTKIHADIVRHANSEYDKYKSVEEEWQRTIAEYQRKLAAYETQIRGYWGEVPEIKKPRKPKKPFFYYSGYAERQDELAKDYICLN